MDETKRDAHIFTDTITKSKGETETSHEAATPPQGAAPLSGVSGPGVAASPFHPAPGEVIGWRRRFNPGAG